MFLSGYLNSHYCFRVTSSDKTEDLDKTEQLIFELFFSKRVTTILPLVDIFC